LGSSRPWWFCFGMFGCFDGVVGVEFRKGSWRLSSSGARCKMLGFLGLEFMFVHVWVVAWSELGV